MEKCEMYGGCWNPPAKSKGVKDAQAIVSAPTKPLMEGCQHDPCSPPDYDAGLLSDCGGGDVGWWQDYIRAEIGRANDHWRGIHAIGLIEHIVTTDHESKDAFIQRLLGILGHKTTPKETTI
jgi:hypothetical protein